MTTMNPVQIRTLDSTADGFKATLAQLLAFEASTDDAIETAVSAILADVKLRGDAAVLEYTNRFDRIPGGAASIQALAQLGPAGRRTSSRLPELPELPGDAPAPPAPVETGWPSLVWLLSEEVQAEARAQAEQRGRIRPPAPEVLPPLPAPVRKKRRML